MKITFIGSRHSKIFQDALNKYINPIDNIMYIDSGIESFYEEKMGCSTFFRDVKNTDVFFLDMLSDHLLSPDRYKFASIYYQKLIWYLHSISPSSEIHIINFLGHKQVLGKFINFLDSLSLSHCLVHNPSDYNKVFSPDDEEINNILSEIFSSNPPVIPEANKNITGKLFSIATKLENKKDFKTMIRTSFPPVLKKKDNKPFITFGIVNCNRLHYLKSCLESLIFSTEEYKNKDFIIVDNSSVEPGTEEYLKEKESEGIRVFRSEKRDPKNEFARGLNTICENSKQSDFVCPLQGDMQFIAKGWLSDYLSFFKDNLENIGCLSLDAQRGWRNGRDKYSHPDPWFAYANRAPICGAGDVIYSRKIIDLIYPWSIDNEAHESNKSKGKAKDSETKMLNKASQVIKENNLSLKFCQPIIPVSCAISTDLNSGMNARISGDELIGDYWPLKESYKYFEIKDYSFFKEKYKDSKVPIGKESIVSCIGYDPPLNKDGHWLKKPIAIKR